MKKRTPIVWGSLGCLGIVMSLQTGAVAADHLNLEEGLPTEVEDAYPIPYKGLEIQNVIQYERNGDEDQVLVEPRIEYGIAPNTQVRLSVPFSFGDGGNDIQDVGLELFYNFNAESLTLPAFAISVSADFPTGSDSAGVDPTVRLLATKTIGNAALDRLHLNLAYTHDFEAGVTERDNRFAAILGYSRRLNSDTMLVSDVVYEQEEEDNDDVVLLELGIRHQLDPKTVFSVGAGAGLTDESPDVRVTIGIQREL